MPHSTTCPLGSTTSTIDTSLTVPTSTSATITVTEPLPYWLVNVPRSEWPAECPDFLLNTTDKNKSILSVPDEEYKIDNWDRVKEIVTSNQIDRFQRVPSHLRKYLEWSVGIKKEYGSFVDYVVKERLGWGGEGGVVPKSTTPFENADDLKILYNDWPYGVEKGIVHLVVWTKFALEDDPATGDMTAESRQQIEDYVQKTFCSRVSAENVRWFKNWSSLKSVKAVEHFHVMLNQPDEAFLKEVTNGDVPLVENMQ
ncbi:hypothetical protein FQN54_004908 [Arachnomyces sp. PD_36]|nr:hypothetical protein FQN54_004908 [Arachnomyces sp. PD_36]